MGREEEALASVLFHPSSYPAATPALITCTREESGRQGEPALAQDTRCISLSLHKKNTVVSNHVDTHTASLSKWCEPRPMFETCAGISCSF